MTGIGEPCAPIRHLAALKYAHTVGSVRGLGAKRAAMNRAGRREVQTARASHRWWVAEKLARADPTFPVLSMLVPPVLQRLPPGCALLLVVGNRLVRLPAGWTNARCEPPAAARLRCGAMRKRWIRDGCDESEMTGRVCGERWFQPIENGSIRKGTNEQRIATIEGGEGRVDERGSVHPNESAASKTPQAPSTALLTSSDRGRGASQPGELQRSQRRGGPGL